MKILDRAASDDGSIKYTFANGKGNVFESIYFTFEGIFDRQWMTVDSVCISTQSGCPVRCAFCATGQSDFRQNLSAEEMQEEVRLVAEDARAAGRASPREIALMGMGEPLLNLESVVQFYHAMKQSMGFSSDEAPLSLSTVGIPANIDELRKNDAIYRLFVSVHSPYGDERSRLIPFNERYPLPAVIGAATRYADATGYRAVASYMLIDGLNDSPKHAYDLAAMLDPELFDVQILLWNEVDMMPYRRPTLAAAKRFEDALRAVGQFASIQTSKGQDVGGGCGQFAARSYLKQ